MSQSSFSRRTFLASATGAVVAGCAAAWGKEKENVAKTPATTVASSEPTSAPAEKIIDIHQHTTYRGRSNEALLHHQNRMGATQTILLPGGSPVLTAATAKGRYNGLYAGAGVVDTCIPIAKAHPREYYFGANEVPDIPEAHDRIEAALKAGAVVIAEQKFQIAVDSPEMERIYALAKDYDVPILMHFEFDTFNTGFERMGKVLEKWPKVKFIAHSVGFWSNIDAALGTKKAGYPRGPVKPGGISDRYLSDHENFYGDLSAGSGLNALTRDEEHARGFIERHQDKLMFGSDCPDPAGFGPTCTGANIISAIRRLSPSKQVERKLLFDNANRLFRL